MKYVSLFAVLLLASCDEAPRGRVSGPQGRAAELPVPPHEETGPEMVESGRVQEVAYRMGSSTTTTSGTPGHEMTITKSWIDDPMGLHNKTVTVPATNSTSTVTIQDQFAVVFECQHGKFLIESLGKESRAAQLWKKLKQGNEVKIRYKEVFYVVPATSRRELVRYEFVDADVSK
jgi:hypothetical protein